MRHPLPALAALVATPVFVLAMHSATAHVAGVPAAHAAATLPNNLCASCHGRGISLTSVHDALGAADMVAARDYLQGASHG